MNVITNFLRVANNIRDQLGEILWDEFFMCVISVVCVTSKEGGEVKQHN
jgi:hypothetical protein